ncbi:hypothetical protein ACFXTH_045142 [Malus domestica]
MEETDSMVDHITKMEVMAKDLANAGHPVSNKMQVSVLFGSLPNSWENVVTSMTYGQVDLTMDTLPAMLAIEEVRKMIGKRKLDKAELTSSYRKILRKTSNTCTSHIVVTSART